MTKSTSNETVSSKFFRAWQTKNSMLLIPIAVLALFVPIGAGIFAESMGAPSNWVAAGVFLVVGVMTVGGLQLNRVRADRELHAEVARINQ